MNVASEEIAASCYLCGSQKHSTCPGTVRDNEALLIKKCNECGLVFLSSFDHITDDFYECSGMHQGIVDIATWRNETAADDTRRFTALHTVIENKRVLDAGCGNGGFIALAGPVTRSIAGLEPELIPRKYLRDSNFTVFSSVDDLYGSWDIITMFHVLEHIMDPRRFLSRLADCLDEKGQIIIEVPNADDALLSLYRNSAFANFTYWSCHLFLYTKETLARVAQQAGLKVNYIRQVQRYPLSNHLYWLGRGKPGGHREWSFLDSPDLHAAYEKQLAAIGACDTIFGSFSKTGA